jgi:hypothetical protein
MRLTPERPPRSWVRPAFPRPWPPWVRRRSGWPPPPSRRQPWRWPTVKARSNLDQRSFVQLGLKEADTLNSFSILIYSTYSRYLF